MQMQYRVPRLLMHTVTQSQQACTCWLYSTSSATVCSACAADGGVFRQATCSRSPHLGEHTLFSPKLHQDSFQVAEVLIISELASTQFTTGGITVGHPNTAAALHILQEHCHHHRHICHVCIVVQFLLKGAQLAR